MMNRIHAALAAAFLLVGESTVLADHGGSQSNTTRLRTRLAGAAISGVQPEGSAEFRSDAQGRTRFQVEVEHVNLPAGTVLTVSVTAGSGATVVGTIKLSADVENELELNAEDGATVPSIKKGDIVTVSNGSTPILAGAF